MTASRQATFYILLAATFCQFKRQTAAAFAPMSCCRRVAHLTRHSAPTERGDDAAEEGDDNDAGEGKDGTTPLRGFGRIGSGFPGRQPAPVVEERSSSSTLKDFAILAATAFLVSRIFGGGAEGGDIGGTRFYYSSESVEITRTRNADGTVNTNVKRDSSERSNIPGFYDQQPRRSSLGFFDDEQRGFYLDE